MTKLNKHNNSYLNKNLAIEKSKKEIKETIEVNKIELAQFDQSSFFYALLAFDDDPLEETSENQGRETD